MTSTRTSDEVHHDYKLNMKQIRSSPRQHEGDIARPNNKPPASQFTGKPSTLWPKRDLPYMDGLPMKGRPRARYRANPPGEPKHWQAFDPLWPKRDPPYVDGLPVKGRPRARYCAMKPPSLAAHSDEPAEIQLLSSRGSIGISSRAGRSLAWKWLPKTFLLFFLLLLLIRFLVRGGVLKISKFRPFEALQ